MEYFIFIACFAVLTVISLVVKDDPGKRIVYYTLVLFVAFITGLRGNTDEYTRFFSLVSYLPDFLTSIDVVAVQKGYFFTLLCSILKTMGFSAQSLFLVVALSSILIHAVYYRKLTKFYVLAFLIYLSHEIYFHEWVGIRMGLASAMVLPMIDLLVRNKKGRFYAVVLLSSQVHYVGILSLGLRWLCKEIKAKYMLWALAIASLIALTNVMGRGLVFLADAGVLPAFIGVYMRWQVYGYDIGLFHPKVLQQIFILLAVLYLKSRKTELPSPYFTLVLNTYFISTFLFILFSDIAILATRFSGHFNVVEPLLLTYLAYYFAEKRVFATVLVLMSLSIGYINYVHRNLIDSYYLYGDTAPD